MQSMFPGRQRRLAALWLGLYLGTTAAAEEPLAHLDQIPHVPDEILVQFRSGIPASSKSTAVGRFGARKLDTVIAERQRPDGGGEMMRVRLPPGIAIAAAVRGLEMDPAVEFAEPNWVYFHTATSNDTYFTNGSLWGMYGDTGSPANTYGSQAARAWAAGKVGSPDVIVGIIDDGVMTTHADLAANIWINPREIANNGKDDDGNGYVDDINGWDFVNNDKSVFDGAADDHGTHLAGTIGAVGGNKTGVAGVNWTVRIISAKFMGPNGGTTSNAIKALDYLTSLKTQQGINIVATNNSWGGGAYSQSLMDAIQRANAANILFIAAAGNGGSDGIGDNNDIVPTYPASYDNDNIIAVAAITSKGALASFSNFGALSVDIAAPGDIIYSTAVSAKGAPTYLAYSGTSQAVAHVTGAAALFAASNPNATASMIKNAILSSAKPTPSLNGKCVSGGRLNVGGF